MVKYAIAAALNFFLNFKILTLSCNNLLSGKETELI